MLTGYPSLHRFFYTSLCDWSVLTNQIQFLIQSRFGRTHFPAVYFVSLWVLIDSQRYFPFFWNSVVITVILVLRRSIKIRSSSTQSTINVSSLHNGPKKIVTIVDVNEEYNPKDPQDWGQSFHACVVAMVLLLWKGNEKNINPLISNIFQNQLSGIGLPL